MTLFTDRVTAGIESALDSVSLRQRVTADNIANMNTPGFKASRVEFENSLASAMASIHVPWTLTPETAVSSAENIPMATTGP